MLFMPGNFCFLTSEPPRSPTFYFAQGGMAQLSTANLCGRVRTDHPHGPLIDITTSTKRHLFFPQQADRNQVRDIVRLLLAHGQPNNANFFLDLAWAAHGGNPQDGHYHYEYTVPATPATRPRTHPSGGTVRLLPQLTQQQIIQLIDQVVMTGGQVAVNGVQVTMPQLAQRVQILRVIADPHAYLADLSI